MNTTDFWYKIVDMTKNNSTVFSIGGIAITGKVLLWIIGIIVAILLVFVIRAAFLWITGADLEKKDAVKTPAPGTPATTTVAPPSLDTKMTEPTKSSDPAASTLPTTATPTVGTPQDLLADTSDRKRTLHDFVTPDTIHAEVLKQTLNNDFPYQTMKPDPTKVAVPVATPVPAPVATQPVIKPQTFGTPTVQTVLPPLNQTVSQAQPTAPVVEPVSAQVSQVVPAQVVTQVPVVAAPSPVAPVTLTVEAPLPSTPIQTTTQPTAPQTNSVLPPLPTTEPRATMIVGVADAPGETGVTAKQYNPADPAIP